MNRVYEIDFICDYDMRYYPFDVQVCTVDLIIDGNTAKFIDLLPGNLSYAGSVDLAQYYIMSHDIYSSEIKGKDGVKVSVTLGRRLLGTILTVYTPTVLLNVIGHASNYFKDFFFEAVVTVNLTCTLVLVTLFINVSEGLPKTSYLKMMDYWLVFNLILPFVEVLLHTYMESLNEDHTTQHTNEKESTGESENGEMSSDPAAIVPGQNVPAVTRKDLISKKEDVQINALRNLYKGYADNTENENKKKQQLCKRFSKIYNPIAALTFVFCYWAIGLKNAQFY